MDSATKQASIVRFGVFEVDLRAGELHKQGRKVKVQDLPFSALKLFLSRPNQVISREELRQALWPGDVFVDFDRGIRSTINRLREALSESANNPVFIETVARSGYRWIAPIQVVTASGEAVADHSLSSQRPAPSAEAPTLRWRHSSRKIWVIAVGLTVLAVGVVVVMRGHRSSLDALRPKTAVAASAHTASPKVEELYLKGRYYWNKRTPDALQQAVDYFSQTILLDPDYAKAYVGLADSYNLLREFAAMPDSEAYAHAFAAASKAVELDPSSADAHATLGFIYFWSKRDLAASIREFERAIALNPNYVDAYHWYGNALNCAGRTTEGLTYLTRAQELDPASASIRADIGVGLVQAGHREEGLALLRQMEATDPNFISPHMYLAIIYLGDLDCPNYLTEARAWARLIGDLDRLAIVVAAEKGFAAGGCPGMLRIMLEEQKKRYPQHQITAYELAQTEALLGDKPAALKYLRLSLAQNEAWLATVRVTPALRSLYPDPEFQRLVVDAGLPPLI